MTTQIIERERVKWDEGFLEHLKSLGIEMPQYFLKKDEQDDDE